MTFIEACEILNFNPNRPLENLKSRAKIRRETSIRPPLRVSVAINEILKTEV